jgi:hypothetical protein
MAEETEGAVSEETTATPEVSEQTNLEATTDAPTEPAPAPSWTEGIEDEKVLGLANRYTTPAAMANALYEANRELSQRVKMPGDDATDEDRAKFQKAMGVPESPDDYEITAPDNMDAASFEAMQGPIKDVIAEMHAAGAPQKVVDAMLSKYFEFETQAQAEVSRLDQEYLAKAEADLRKEWGSGYDENMAFANDFLTQSPELAQLELKDGMLLGSHPAFVKRMAEVGRLTNEGQLRFGVAGQAGSADLQAEYDQLSREIHAAYNSGDRAKAAQLDAQRNALSEKLHGNNSVVGAGRAF